MLKFLMKWLFKDLKDLLFDVEELLLEVKKENKIMTANINDLKTAISVEASLVQELITSFEAFLAKVVPTPDVQAELDQVNANIAALKTLQGEIPADTVEASTGSDTVEAGA